MANKRYVLDKLARNADQLGLTVASRGVNGEVVISNGSNNLTISYVQASIQSPMGGVDDSSSPFLGMGIANPGKIQITSSIHTNSSIADVMDSLVAAKTLAMCASLANDIILQNDNASFSGQIRGHSDLIGLGM